MERSGRTQRRLAVPSASSPANGESGRRRARAPAHRFRPGKVADHRRHQLGDDLLRRAARLRHDGDVEIALLRVGLDLRLVDRGKPGAAQKTLDRLLRRADARALLLLAHVGRARRQPMHGQRQPPRRGEGLGALIGEPGLDQPVGDQPAQILRRLPLHARGNFLGEKFEKQIGHRHLAGDVLSKPSRL